MITAKLFPSLTEIRPESVLNTPDLEHCTVCSNEPISVQLAYRITDGSAKNTIFTARVESALDVRIYEANCVPVLHTDLTGLEQPPAIGLYPDILIPRETNPAYAVHKAGYDGAMLHFDKTGQVPLNAFNDSWQILWLCINEEGKRVPAGNYPLRVTLTDAAGNFAGSCELTVEVLADALPTQKLMCTNWFHCDCLADYYRVPIFSEDFFKIMEDYVRKAVRNGMNMILLPAFTPPLDTPVGEERPTAQLVGVTAEKGKYQFDFTLLRKYIRLCKKCGIRYFEHSHLFSQWGAFAAPKVVATVRGREKVIFGWNTEASGEPYRSFLRQYLTALKPVLEEEKIEKRILFHISDEPHGYQIESYKKALDGVRELLKGYMVGDALSSYDFYDQGVVDIPIVCTTSVHDFIGKCKNLWCYYTGGQIGQNLTNRLLMVSRCRNRILGVQMYYHRIRGFLHWGYNYYYGTMSHGQFDPKLNPASSYGNGGTCYLVYPANDGTAWQSIRQKIFGEGLLDMRSLELLEKKAGRKVCEEIIHRHFGVPDFRNTPVSDEKLLAFRKDVYDAIKAC